MADVRRTTAVSARAEYAFTVKERADGEPFIVAELLEGYGLPALDNGFLGFTLRPGTTIEQAHALAKMMRQMIGGLSHTLSLERPEPEQAS